MKLDRQTTYDIVRDHLMTQGRQSVGLNIFGSTQCRYRGDDGTMCAIGCLMPDREYRSSFEGESARGLRVRKAIAPVVGFASNDKDVVFLRDLQAIHDIRPVDKWDEALYGFALEHGLRP